MNKNGTEPIVSIEKVVQYAIVVRLWSNHGRKVPHHPRKVPHKQKKALKTNGFQGFDGGDKRDRTADLLNAIQALSQLSYTPKFRPRLRTAFVLSLGCGDLSREK